MKPDLFPPAGVAQNVWLYTQDGRGLLLRHQRISRLGLPVAWLQKLGDVPRDVALVIVRETDFNFCHGAPSHVGKLPAATLPARRDLGRNEL